MQMCKAKNASHIRTASTAAAEYPKAKTTNRRLHKIFDTTPFSIDNIMYAKAKISETPALTVKTREPDAVRKVAPEL
jgi:hypothetical protein